MKLKYTHYFSILIALVLLCVSHVVLAAGKAVIKKKKSSTPEFVVTVAIDPGHGGKDPGAIGHRLGIKEKEVTLSISKELKRLLDADSNFKAILTRNQDIFIKLSQRTEIARRHKANVLISIHADSSPTSTTTKGVSVWVLSNRRANNEMGRWLEDHEKQSELLGGVGELLSNHNERYVNQTVLDLQFSHSQKMGYELGTFVLNQLTKLTPPVKSTPQHASLSVLRSPDIPSILIETGFLSNPIEEQKLSSIIYRKQIAKAIYNGLILYRNRIFTLQSTNTLKKVVEEKEIQENKKSKSSSAPVVNKKSSDSENKVVLNIHIVQNGETLYSIAKKYNTTPENLSKLNHIKNNYIWVGKKLKLK